jgi:hypothetical protein
VSLAIEAADEAFAALGALSLPEWPRLAVLHDLAVVYRDGDRPERWQRVLDAVGDSPRAAWPERMRLMSGPRAQGALEAANRLGAGAARDQILARVGLALLGGAHGTGGRPAPRTRGGRGRSRRAVATGRRRRGGLRGLGVERRRPHAARALSRCPARSRSRCTGRLSRSSVAWIWISSPGSPPRLAGWRATAPGEGALRGAVDRAEAGRREATDALERTRRGPAAAIAGGHVPDGRGALGAHPRRARSARSACRRPRLSAARRGAARLGPAPLGSRAARVRVRVAGALPRAGHGAGPGVDDGEPPCAASRPRPPAACSSSPTANTSRRRPPAISSPASRAAPCVDAPS